MTAMGSRALGLNINRRFEFSNDTQLMEPTADRICIDIGQQLCPGVIDHHQGDGEPSCAAREVIDHPEFILDHLLAPLLKSASGHPAPRAITWSILTHTSPDWDAVLASYLAVRIAEDGIAPESIRHLAQQATEWDQGRAVFDPGLKSIAPALLYTIEQADLSADYEKLAFGFRLLDYLKTCAEDPAVSLSPASRELYEGHAEFGNVVRKLDADSQKYHLDVKSGQRLTLDLPCRSGGRRAVSTLICQTNPHSRLLKHWAHSLGIPGSEPAKSVECLIVPYGQFRAHPSGSGNHFKRVVISVRGNSDVFLDDIGRQLELLEQQERKHRGIVQCGDARYPEISPSPDPWYDGRGHNYTIVDSPRSGTLLSYRQIIDCVLTVHASPITPSHLIQVE